MTATEFGIRNSEFGISVPPIASRTRSRFRPTRHAGRVPHAASRITLRRHKQTFLLVMAKSGGRSQMGQPSRLPSGGCRECAAPALPPCHPDRRPGGPQRRDLRGGLGKSVAWPSHRDPSARSLRSLGRDDMGGESLRSLGRDDMGGESLRSLGRDDRRHEASETSRARGTNTRWSTTSLRDLLEKRLCGWLQGVGLRKRFQSEAIDGPARRPVDVRVRRSPERCGCRPGGRPRNPILGTGGEQGDSRRNHAGVSSHSEKFVTDEADPNGLRDIPVEEERADRLLDVSAQLLPGFSLSDDGLRQTFGNVTAVHFLGHLEYDFGSHTASLPPEDRMGRPHRRLEVNVPMFQRSNVQTFAAGWARC